MLVNTKYSIGDRVYRLESGLRFTHEPCPVCDGAGEIGVSKKLKCYNSGCDGGTISSRAHHAPSVSDPFEVFAVRLDVDANGNTIRYLIGPSTHVSAVSSGEWVLETEMYSSAESAQDVVNRKIQEELAAATE